MDLKRVNKIPKKYKDVISGFTRAVQSMLPDDNAYYNIVDLIKHIILLYYYRLFESKILSETEQERFMQFLEQNNKTITDYSWQSIFDSRKDGLKCSTFIDKVHDHQNVILLIQVQGDTVIGGYTKTGWSKTIHENAANGDGDAFSADKDAFVFHFKSSNGNNPFISNVKQDQRSISNALGYWKGHYGMFGSFWLFCMHPIDYDISRENENSTFDSRCHEGWNNNYECYAYEWRYITGAALSCIDNVVIEVFQIQM